MNREPIITEEDRRQYKQWLEECRWWAQTHVHRRRVKWAKEIVYEMIRKCDAPYISWSGGKDSTALVHLICVEMGLNVPVVSLVTDIEPPNTESYMTRLAGMWGLDLEIIRPPISFRQWLADHANEVDLYGQVATGHTAIGGIWDDTIRNWEAGSVYTGNFWGIRRDESRGRELNYRSRGAVYQMRNEYWRAAPFSGWEAKDIFGYCETHGVELMRLYQCVRLTNNPGMIRKSMMLPDDKGGRSHDQGIWIRTYFPSVFEGLKSILPQMAGLT